MILLLAACGKPNPTRIAHKFCGMMETYIQTDDPNEREKLETEMEKFEKDFKAKYGDDKEYMEKIDNAINDCAEKIGDKLKEQD